MKSRDDRIGGPKPLASSAARRVEAIIEGAERAAERVIDDAEATARAYLVEAEAEADRAVAARLASLGELTDALVAQADAIRRQSELLTGSLREAKQRLETEAGSGSAGAPPVAEPAEDRVPAEKGGAGERRDPGEEPRTPHLSAVESAEPAAAEGSSAEPVAERRGGGTPAGARLLATQMAVSGSSREEIAMRLRTGFEIEDTDAILDAILGPEA
jgi:hypothetical protein